MSRGYIEDIKRIACFIAFSGLVIFFYPKRLDLVLLFGGYFSAVYALWKKGLLKRYNMSLHGIFVAWETKRGRERIDRVARHERFWVWYGNLSVAICAIVAILITIWLLWIAFAIVPVLEEAPSPEIALVLPGINPVIPLQYGILALALTLIVHEFGHAILSRAAKVPLKAFGIIFCILPVGAFIEPDERKLKRVSRKKRLRIYAAGPAANIILAVICLLIFSCSFIANLRVREGALVAFTVEGSPAHAADIKPYTLITAINGMKISDKNDFQRVMKSLKPGQSVTLSLFYGSTFDKNITLTSKWKIYQLWSPRQNKESYRNQSHLGVAVYSSSDWLLKCLNPYAHIAPRIDKVVHATLWYIVLPFSGLVPVQPPLTDIYIPSGPWSFLPRNLFWLLSNTLYWLFWTNLVIGMSNTAPAIPFDGGHIFNESIDVAIEKIERDEKKRKRCADAITYAASLLIFSLIAWQLIGPRI